MWKGSGQELEECKDDMIQYIRKGVSEDLISMEKRGGGILEIQLGKNWQIPGLYFLEAFDTVDAMGANLVTYAYGAHEQVAERVLGRVTSG